MKEAPEFERPQRAEAIRPHPERADPVSTEATQPQRAQATRAQRAQRAQATQAQRADRAKAEPERVEPQAVEVQRAGRRGVVVERA